MNMELIYYFSIFSLIQVNCKEDGLDASAIEECKSGRKVYMAYK